MAEPPEAYLAPAPLIDSDAPDIVSFVRTSHAGLPAVEAAERAYHFVRDEVAHSWDVRASRVTRSASEAMQYREGICYPKSHLLAALLRAARIPAALCYQRLTLLDDDSSGYAVHSLNAVYIGGARRRLDARGNKAGVDARFSLDRERLAFAVRDAYDETDYPWLLDAPHPAIEATLRRHDDAIEMYRHGLPSELSEPLRPALGASGLSR